MPRLSLLARPLLLLAAPVLLATALPQDAWAGRQRQAEEPRPAAHAGNTALDLIFPAPHFETRDRPLDISLVITLMPARSADPRMLSLARSIPSAPWTALLP